jgi:RNA polymerase sigma-70 factor (ECF subfamily)
MTRISDGRALWLARNVLPHEHALRCWLSAHRLRGIEPDDVIQETYAILAGLECVDAIRSPKAYMFKTAHSVIMAQVRRAQIVSITTIDDINQLADEDQAPSPETEVSDRQELQRLADAIASLPHRCREVFVYRKIHGLSQRDVARQMGISEGTVEKQMHKGLKILAATIGRRGNSSPQASTVQGASPIRKRDI